MLAERFLESSHKVRAIPTFWEHSGKVFQNVPVIYVRHYSSQNMKQTEIYKDGLHELRVMSKNRLISGQMVYKDSLVIMSR